MDSINNACKFGSDAWLELQAFKTRQLNRREKLNRHKNLHKDLIDGIASNQANQPSAVLASTSSSSLLGQNNNSTNNISNATSCNNTSIPNIAQNSSSNPSTSKATTQHQLSTNSSSLEPKLGDSKLDLGDEAGHSISSDISSTYKFSNNNNSILSKPNLDASPTTLGQSNKDAISRICATSSETLPQDRNNHCVNLELVECLLLLKLCDVALKLPIDSRSLQRSICKIRGLESTSQPIVENLLQKFAHQELITLDESAVALLGRVKKQIINHLGSATAPEDDLDHESCIYVTSADHTKLVEFDKSFGSLDNIRALLIEPSRGDDISGGDECDLPGSSVSIHSARSLSSSNPPSDRDDYTLDDSLDSKHSNRSHHHHHHQNQDGNTSSKSNEFDHKSISSAVTQHKGSSISLSNSIKKKLAGDDLESLLSLSSTKERESKKLGEELLELLSKPTAKERNLLERFRSADGYQVQEFCPKGTKGECNRNNKGAGSCDKLHFKKIIAKHTEESLGDCSFLNTCFHMDSCKYVHYEVDYDHKQQSQLQQQKHLQLHQHQFKRPHPAESIQTQKSSRNHDTSGEQAQPMNSTDRIIKPNPKTASSSLTTTTTTTTNTTTTTISNKAKIPASSVVVAGLPGTSASATQYTLSPEEQARIDAKNRKRFKTVLYPPQWIQCDLRFFDMSLLGKFSVVMADPPWDIHMELPYGTLSDEEMRKLNIPALQDEGVIFLWVTGRAMELGRECLALWGYERCDEIIWVKTNQLQRIIRTGRTGHWLNHGKEHCLVGVKGNPKDINRGLDCDVIVAEVRATSHKPDEIYGIIERLSPGTRKIELFGRAHNVQPNWITLGNQLNGVRLIEPNLVNAFKKLNLPFQTVDTVT